MSRTLLFLAVLAALLCVGVSEQDLKGRAGLSGISNSNNNKDNNKNFLNKITDFLHLTGEDGATEKGKVDEDSHDNGNGKGHDQHGNGLGKGHDKKVDCVVGEWQSWTSCSKTCGGGTRPRTRAILTQPSYGGRACPETAQDQPCNTQSCEVPCVVGEWSNWGSCSKTCDGGNQTRTRPILTQPSYGGHPCPETTQIVPCNTQHCEVPCVVGEWSNWGSCSKTCNGGNQTRTRPILTQPSYGGHPCPETTQIVPCNTQGCGVDCGVSEWQPWGSCSKSCGGGVQYRTRRILTPASGNGRPCPDTSSSVPCNTQSCGY